MLIGTVHLKIGASVSVLTFNTTPKLITISHTNKTTQIRKQKHTRTTNQDQRHQKHILGAGTSCKRENSRQPQT